MKFCTIGCGGHAYHSHGPAQQLYARNRSDVELSACCDLNPKLAEAYRAAYGFKKSYIDIHEMIHDEKPDALALIVPAGVAGSLAVPLLESGIPLLLEKPPGLHLRDFESLLAAAEKGGGRHLVAFNRRYAPVIVKARQWLDESFPKEQVFSIRYDMVRHARNDADFSITAIHAIDAALFLARSPYLDVRFSYREIPQSGKGVAVYSMNGHFANGTEISITFQPLSGLVEETVSIYAQDQNIHIDLIGENASFAGSAIHYRGGEKANDFKVIDATYTQRIGIYGETEAFLDNLKNKLASAPELKDCRQQVVLMEAIRERKPHVRFSEENLINGKPCPERAAVAVT